VGAVSGAISPDQEGAAVASAPHDLLIGGAWRPAASAGRIEVTDPATGREIGTVADADIDDARLAVDAAAEAQPEFESLAPRERGEILRAAFELMSDRGDDLALLVTLEMGKPLSEARAEVAYAAEFFRWFGEEAARIDGGYMRSPEGRSRLLVQRQPVGPCLMITPWNFPLAMGTRKIGPALAAGCTTILKPAAQTPLSMLAVAGILTEAGVPPGVVNVLPTSDPAGVVAAIMADERIRKVSFTGSTSVGHQIQSRASEHAMRVSLELGGNAPFLVFADADLGAAVEGAIIAKMRNAGQACTAANRLLVHADVATEFTEALARRMDELVVGRGTEPDVEVGPLIDTAAVEKVDRLVGAALASGAKLELGGRRLAGSGNFYAPTVLTELPPISDLNEIEIFGPVAAVSTFADELQAVEYANHTSAGLTSYLYTRDVDTAFRVSERLQTGMVGVNTGLVSNPAAPFGGVKGSGLGREGGFEGLLEYLETKYVAFATAA